MTRINESNLVVISEHLSEAPRQWLADRCRVIECRYNDPQFFTHLNASTALIVRTYTRVDENLLHHAPHLRVVGRAGVALENIDLAACRDRGITVVHTPEANTQAVVEFVLCLLCDDLRPRLTLDRAISGEEWNTLRQNICGERQMSELTLGIMGLGRIGKRISAVAGAIGMTVLYHDLLDIPPAPPELRSGATPVSAEDLFRESDIVSVHIDSRPVNRHFVGESLLQLMKDEVLFLNTSRGFVVDHAALGDFLKKHPRARAWLDVHDPEPFPADFLLLGMPGVHLSPHLAARTSTAMENMSWVVRDIHRVLTGEPPAHPAAPVE